MLCRCVHHWRYLDHYMEQPTLSRIVPSCPWLVYTILVGCGLALEETWVFPYSLRRLCIHLGVGVVAGVSVLILLFVCDKKTVQEVRALFHKRKSE